MLRLDNLSAGYDGQRVVHDINVALPTGHIGCLLGPSGCGKTTLLRVIAGFEPVLDGAVQLNGQVVSRPGSTLPPEKRGIGVVFQDLALFPHLPAAANIAFGLQGQSSSARAARVSELLSLVGLEGSGARYPHELSGGQQQRVALARALAPRPRLLLLDEPFSSLDLELRETLAADVHRILKREAITALLVTHDQFEAFAMADHIAVMRTGRIEQQAGAHTLYHEPASRFVAGFIGQGRLLRGVVMDAQQVDTVLGRLSGKLPAGISIGSVVEVLVRPDDLVLDASGAVEATVVARAFRGALYLYTLRLVDGTEVLAAASAHDVHEPGDTLRLRTAMRDLVTFATPAAD